MREYVGAASCEESPKDGQVAEVVDAPETGENRIKEYLFSLPTSFLLIL